MQFVRHGPDIPERLLQAHEDGRVVFFCGAGISYPARLPGFPELVDKLYTDLAAIPNAVQLAAIKAGQFDTAISLLEADIVGGRETVRRALAGILTPDLSAPNATATHEALLTLGKYRNGHTRLITTNFDRLFEEVIAAKSLPIERFQAPLLPVPKNRWDGLVYLHGLLTAEPTTSNLDRLVVSSGDFGLAYLTECWAARFVSELFRNYTVCFVGYRINDPVLRYMMDALAADRLLGESPPEMFAFGSYSNGKEEERANEWRAKNVTPILYHEHDRHAYLHKSLRAWAETYRDGVRGKEHIVVECALARPLPHTKQDYFIPRMLWALGDPSGLPAKRFAEMDPVPSLDWLEPLSESRYGHADLRRFGVPAHAAEDGDLKFSLLDRPAPYLLAPQMGLVGWSASRGGWDSVMGYLAAWLTRHLDDPALVLWMARRGGQLHVDFIRAIERRLDELATLERKGKTAELARIRENAPNAIPRPAMRILWGLLIAGLMKSRSPDLALSRWPERFNRDGCTATLRLHLRNALSPRISLSEPFPRPIEDGQRCRSERIRDLVAWKLVLATDHVHSALDDLSRNEQWTAALPSMLADCSALLRDAADLMRELGDAGDRHDWSYLHQPSIGKHAQNRDFRDWTALIDLTRDAWLAMAAQSPERATLEAEIWWQTPYPVFKRLAFFAAAQGEVIAARCALEWLLADEHWCLWSNETRRETVRLLVALAPRLDAAMQAELEQAILAGPSQSMFSADIAPERWTSFVNREIWLRLAKIAQTGAVLGPAGRARLDAFPAWGLADDERDEFGFWMEEGGDWRTFVPTPRRRRELVEWLRQRPRTDDDYVDDWSQRCRDNFATTACALCVLASEGIWLEGRWWNALQAWSEEKHLKRSWRYIAPVLADAPDDLMQAIAQNVSWWLLRIVETRDCDEALFMALTRRILALDYPHRIDDTDHYITRAINHPVGQVTEALVNGSNRDKPTDGQGLSDEIKSIFTEICDIRMDKFRHGRVLLAANLVYLFRVDPPWATQHLLPLFDWERSADEAPAAWTGFSSSARLYPPLMRLLKPAFLATALHYNILGGDGKRYASMLAFAALDPGDVFTRAELADATRALPPDGLQETAKALVRQLESAGDQRAAFWANRIVPYLQNIWPKGRQHATPAIAERFGRLCIAAQDAFPEAVRLLGSWLQAQDNPFDLVLPLHEAELCGRFPRPALEFLDRVIGDQTRWLPEELGTCLEAIREAAPELEDDQRFERLMVYSRQYGQG